MAVGAPLAVAFEDPVKGRGLGAARAIQAGEEVLREEPAAIILGNDVDSSVVKECHEMVAQILLASWTAELAEPIRQLVSFVEQTRERDPGLLDEVATHATGAVRALVKKRAGAGAAAKVNAEVVVQAYCKHLLSSTHGDIRTPPTLQAPFLPFGPRPPDDMPTHMPGHMIHDDAALK